MPRPEFASLSRRSLLKAGVGGTAALGLGVGFGARRARAAGGPAPDLDRWLLDHATQGFTVIDARNLADLGYRRWLEEQLHPERIFDPRVDRILEDEFPSLGLDYSALYHRYTIRGLDYVPMLELKAAALVRSLYSHRQLYERMVEFWNDHFSIDHSVSSALQTVFDREVIRKHALGNFRDMLEASARAGAMLIYLNNDTNVVGHAQENYARELMELHTLGVTGPYTEQDVGEVARCFTGWSPYNSQLYLGEFVFRAVDHDFGAKTVLGHALPAGHGEEDGKRVLRILARHRSTSEYLARKMCRWLLHQDPSDALVADVARAYRQNDGDIKSMIRVIFDPDHVVAEGWPSLVKYKRPFQFVTSLMRATGAQTDGWHKDLIRGYEVLLHLVGMGHSPFDNATPDGYPDDGDSWASSVLPRWKFAHDYAENRLYLVHLSLDWVQAQVGPITQENCADRIQALFGGALSEEDLEQVRRYVLEVRPFHEARIREAIALAAGMPSFQTY